MNKDKVKGYVQAMIDNYFNKFEKEDAPYVKNHLGTILEDLGNLKDFMEIEEVAQEGLVQEQPEKLTLNIDGKEIAKVTCKSIDFFPQRDNSK